MHIDSRSTLGPKTLFFGLLVLFFLSAVYLNAPGDRNLFSQDTASLGVDSAQEIIPDFTGYADVDEKKQAFFEFLQPYVDAENQRILAQRNELLLLLEKTLANEPLLKKEQHLVSALSEEYELETLEPYSENHLRLLLRRVDVIPTSLVLAQAANESAWGTSRFAIDGNNFFGQWCYTEGCGIVPERRHRSASHEVQSFASVQDSVRAYFMNINTFHRYQDLRRVRMQLRNQNKPVDGFTLSKHLMSYSERGQAYIDELQSMIIGNNLLALDEEHRFELEDGV